jgi:transcriptional regulator with GAF, ATPase, and Fis domain
VGVLAIGSTATESFSEEDRDFLVQFGDLLTQVMGLCHRGLRWETDQEVYRVYSDLEHSLLLAHDEESVANSFIHQIHRLFPFDRFTLCIREGEEGHIRFVFGQVDTIDRGIRFPLEEGLNGWIIKRNVPLIIADMAEGDYVRPRYFVNENIKHGLHSFIGIPLTGGEQEAWGCISLESRTVGQYGEKGKQILTSLSIPLQLALERVYLKEKL